MPQQKSHYLQSQAKKLLLGICTFALCTNITTAWFGQEKGKSFAKLYSQQFQFQYDGISTPPSPIEIKKGIVPKGTDRLEVIWTTETANKTFNIPVEQWKEYSLTFGINYDNLTRGKNRYLLAFRKGAQLMKLQQFQINVAYQTIPLQSRAKVQLLVNEQHTGNTKPLLMKYDKEYKVIEAPYLYDKAKKYLLQPQKMQKDKKSGITYAELYFNGEFLTGHFPYQAEDQSGNQAHFSYDSKRHQLMVSRALNNNCKYQQGAKGISTKTKQPYLDLSLSKQQ